MNLVALSNHWISKRYSGNCVMHIGMYIVVLDLQLICVKVWIFKFPMSSFLFLPSLPGKLCTYKFRDISLTKPLLVSKLQFYSDAGSF